MLMLVENNVEHSENLYKREQILTKFSTASFIQPYLNFKLYFLNNSFANHSYDVKEHFESKIEMNIHENCVFHLNNKFFK